MRIRPTVAIGTAFLTVLATRAALRRPLTVGQGLGIYLTVAAVLEAVDRRAL